MNLAARAESAKQTLKDAKAQFALGVDYPADMPANVLRTVIESLPYPRQKELATFLMDFVEFDRRLLESESPKAFFSAVDSGLASLTLTDKRECVSELHNSPEQKRLLDVLQSVVPTAHREHWHNCWARNRLDEPQAKRVLSKWWGVATTKADTSRMPTYKDLLQGVGAASKILDRVMRRAVWGKAPGSNLAEYAVYLLTSGGGKRARTPVLPFTMPRLQELIVTLEQLTHGEAAKRDEPLRRMRRAELLVEVAAAILDCWARVPAEPAKPAETPVDKTSTKRAAKPAAAKPAAAKPAAAKPAAANPRTKRAAAKPATIPAAEPAAAKKGKAAPKVEQAAKAAKTTKAAKSTK